MQFLDTPVQQKRDNLEEMESYWKYTSCKELLKKIKYLNS